MKICLFYIAKSTFGGWVTYTTHLIRSLRMLGAEVELYKIGNRDEKRERPYAEEIFYRNVTVETARQIAEDNASLILVLDKRFYERGLPVLEKASGIVIHDPNEISKPLVQFMQEHGKKALVIRKAMLRHFDDTGIEAQCIMHPYVPYEIEINKDWHAVSTSRLDWDKYTHYIVEANGMLPPSKRVCIYGAENRLYCFNKLTPKFPEWRNYWGGRFKYGEGAKFSARSEFTIDLTEIKGDGGGTQYTFLEAFNAFSTLIINKKWLSTEPDRLIDGVNCIAVDSAEELKDVLLSEVDHDSIREKAFELLHDHTPEVIVPQYLDFLGL